MTQIIRDFACKFALICVFAIKGSQEMKMESVSLMASALLSTIVDQTNIVMNVETLARKQTVMMIQKIHQFVLSVSDAFSRISSL